MEEFKYKLYYLAFEEVHRLHKFHTGESKTITILHETFAAARKVFLIANSCAKNIMNLYELIAFIDEALLSNADKFYKRYYKKQSNITS